MRANAAFENILQNCEDLKIFCGKIFMVYDINHRLPTWLPIIDRDHTDDPTSYYVVENIILDVEKILQSWWQPYNKSFGNFIYSFIFIYSFNLNY